MADKSSRPKFSAPIPPAGKTEVLVNSEETRPLTDTVVETKPDDRTIPIDTGSIAPKTVSKSVNAADSSIDTVLSEKNTQKISPPTPAVAKPKQGSHCNAILVGITVFSLIIGVAGWFLYFTSSSNVTIFGGSTPPAPTMTPAPAVSPTPATANKAAISLEVLNGSGVSGLAGKTADTLAGLGYTILKTGNADNSNYAVSEVYTNPEFLNPEVLIADLEKTFGSATVSGTLKDSTASARIIVGKDWAE